MKSVSFRYLVLGLFVISSTGYSQTSRPSKSGSKTIVLPSGWKQSVSGSDWHFETIKSLRTMDGIFRDKKDREFEIISSHSVEGLDQIKNSQAFLKEACNVRKGQLVEVGKNQFCRVEDVFGKSRSLQYFASFDPKSTRKLKTPFVYVQYWTVPKASGPKVQARVENLLARGLAP